MVVFSTIISTSEVSCDSHYVGPHHNMYTDYAKCLTVEPADGLTEW